MALSTTRTLLTQTGINTHQVFNVGGLDSIGIATFSNFKTGTSDVHSSGYNVGTGLTVRANYIGLTGDISATGVITATSFVGSGTGLTGVASTDHIKTSTVANFTGGIQVGGATTLTGATSLTGALSATTATANLIVVGSAVTSNSQGIDVTGIVTATTVKVGSAVSITDGAVSATRFHGDGSQLTGITGTTINNNADNRVITGSGSANTLEGESSLTYNGLQLNISNDVPELFLTDTNSNNSYGRVRGNGGNLILSADVNNATGDSVIVFESDGSERARIASNGIANFQKAVGIGSYTTTQRDAIAYLQAGTLIFNNSTGTVQVWDGGSWTNLTEPFSASGGTKTTSGSKTIHTFTGNGNFTVASNATNVRALIVGGGGGGGGKGGNDGSGGGGGGLVRFVTGIPVTPGSYPIVIGGGGGSSGGGSAGGDGGSSSAFGNTSPGGGGGGSESPSPRAGRPGGCGGGGGGFGGGGGTGSGDPGAPTDTDLETDGNTPSNGWGNDGGANQYPGGMNYGGGGGGGAQHYGMPGKNPNSVPTQYAMHTYSGNGGNGVGYSISGSPGHYAGGGGCGGNGHHGNNGPGSYGGRGGGGNGGGGPFGSANSGTGGTGGGGGGAAAGNSPAPNHNSGGGGSGIVIIDYDTP